MNNKTKILISVTVLVVVVLSTFSVMFFVGQNNEGNKTSEISQSSNSQVAEASSSLHTNSGAANSTDKTTGQAISTEQNQDKEATKVNPLQLSPSIEEVKVKAVYLSGASASLTEKVDSIIEIAKNTELNTVVVDIKEDGIVNYDSNVPMVKEFKNIVKYYNAEKLVKKFHDNGIYVIGRIVVFKDPVLSTKRADLAIKNAQGQVWKENGETSWTNPYMEETWDYNIAIAKEAIEKGFDEIQFDYVRFPTGRKGEFNYGPNVPEKAEAINGFLAKAQKELHDELGTPVSADVFAIITESKVDGENIGQRIEEVGKDIYCISPMIYPSHYANNAKKGVMANGVGQDINGVLFTKPDLDPYGVVYNALLSTKTKTENVEGYNAKVRPYIQAFTAKYLPAGYFQTYGAEQIKQQMKAVYDAGYEEWILWDPRNKYSEDYFEKN